MQSAPAGFTVDYYTSNARDVARYRYFIDGASIDLTVACNVVIRGLL